MNRLRLTIASLLFASVAATGCVPSATAGSTRAPVTQQAIDRAALRAKLAERRDLTIERFLAYREARVYPINDLRGSGMRHQWIDAQGHLCAAATLLSLDWGREATLLAGKKDYLINIGGLLAFKKLANVTKGPIADWILTSGLTHHEIVAIQVPGSDMFPAPQESDRMYQIYVDVERQLSGLRNEALDEATDALMKRPELAREVLDGKVAGPGPYAVPVA